MRMVFIVYAMMFLYITLRVVWPLPVRWWWKLLLAVPLAAGAFKFSILHRVNPAGRYFAPDVDAGLLLPLTWLNVFLILCSMLLLMAELPRLVAWCILRRRGLQGSEGALRARRWVNGALAALAALATSVGMYQAFSAPRVHELELEIPGMAADAPPVTVALLADLHADTVKREPYFRALMEQVNALGADAVVISGDFVDGSLAARGRDLAPLAGLRAPLGVFGVPGNHDYGSGYAEWMEFFSRCGIRMLPNAHAPLGQGLELAGVTDPAAEWAGEEGPDLAKALSGVPAGKPVVLLAHQPVLAPQAAQDSRVALQLSGHTHGGMFPGLAQIVAKYNGGYVNGLYSLGRLRLYVSPGTSLWSGMPVRIFCPGEITLITLRPARAEG